MSQFLSNNINSLNAVNVWNNSYIIADDRSQILSWLSPLEPRLRHRDVQANRVENVGEWLLQTEEFRNWYAGSGADESGNAVLFCYGDPGVGKTFISSVVVDRLCDRAKGQNAAVACFYFDFAAHKEQLPTSMMGALLKQVVSGRGEVPEEVAAAYEDQKKVIGGRVPQLSDIVRMLQTTSSKIPTFICLDALDECVAGNRVKILDSLKEILRKSPGTRIFVTGRPYIRPEIVRRLGGRVESVSISPRRDDIIRYLRTRLDEDTTPEAMDGSLEADILKKIPEDISEIFLLVSLNIDAILQETIIHRRRQRLSAMADGLGLGDAYGTTLGRIKGQGGEKSRLGMVALMWISHSERPLKVDELCHALAVEIESPNLDTSNVPAIETLLACCQGLVLVDKEASTVRLIHFTLQEYLRAHPQIFGAAHSTMAETCLSYLNSAQVNAFSLRFAHYSRDVPFLEYSSLYWGTHARRGLSDCAKLLALKLFDDFSNHISGKILLKAQNCYWLSFDWNKPTQFGGLHCASFFGIADTVASLVEVEGCDINQEDCTGNSPLTWATRNGHDTVVKILLEQHDIDPNKANSHGNAPLVLASWRGHEEVVKLLLGREDIDPNKPDDEGKTPLCCAAENGHEGVVEILLGRDDVDSNKPNDQGQTPLCCAARRGHAGVVKILLGRDDVDPNKSDDEGQTPLCCAAENGHEGVVEILLGRDDVDPNEPDYNCQTPLSFACEDGHEEVVKILLGRDDVDPDKPDSRGNTPLMLAAWNGREGIVKILLGLDDVDPNKRDNEGETPLYCAARRGHEGVVKILLGRDNVDPNEPDNEGETPLCCAAHRGHEGVVKVLLGRDDVDPSKPDSSDNTPLMLAAWSGHEGVVRILLGRDDVDPDKPDDEGATPLYRAAQDREGTREW